MTEPGKLLSGEPDDVEELLLQVARRERAPRGARDQALARVAAVSLSAVVASTAKAAPTALALKSGGAVLWAKWLAIGLGGALVGLTIIDRAGRALDSSAGALATSGSAPVATVPKVAPLAALSVSAPVGSAPVAHQIARAVPSLPIASHAPVPEGADSVEPTVPRPSAAEFAEPGATQLAREVAALRQARAALAQGKPVHALEAMAAYHREFPVGVLGVEEAALRVEIAFAVSDPKAPELAQHFVAQNPSSPLSVRVRSLLDAQRASGAKP